MEILFLPSLSLNSFSYLKAQCHIGQVGQLRPLEDRLQLWAVYVQYCMFFFSYFFSCLSKINGALPPYCGL